jgi:hypothetical protein
VRDKLKLQNEIGCARVGHQLILAGGHEGRIELGVGPVGVAGEGRRKQAAVASGVGDEDRFGGEDGRGDWAGLRGGELWGENGNRRKESGAYNGRESKAGMVQRKFLLVRKIPY